MCLIVGGENPKETYKQHIDYQNNDNTIVNIQSTPVNRTIFSWTESNPGLIFNIFRLIRPKHRLVGPLFFFNSIYSSKILLYYGPKN